MTSALMLVAVIVLFGLLFVVVPVIFDAYNRYRERKLITCPETRGPAEVTLKTRLAAFGAAFGKPSCAFTPTVLSRQAGISSYTGTHSASSSAPTGRMSFSLPSSL